VIGRLLISEVGLARIALRVGTATGSSPSHKLTLAGPDAGDRLLHWTKWRRWTTLPCQPTRMGVASPGTPPEGTVPRIWGCGKTGEGNGSGCGTQGEPGEA